MSTNDLSLPQDDDDVKHDNKNENFLSSFLLRFMPQNSFSGQEPLLSKTRSTPSAILLTRESTGRAAYDPFSISKVVGSNHNQKMEDIKEAIAEAEEGAKIKEPEISPGKGRIVPREDGDLPPDESIEESFSMFQSTLNSEMIIPEQDPQLLKTSPESIALALTEESKENATKNSFRISEVADSKHKRDCEDVKVVIAEADEANAAASKKLEDLPAKGTTMPQEDKTETSDDAWDLSFLSFRSIFKIKKTARGQEPLLAQILPETTASAPL